MTQASASELDQRLRRLVEARPIKLVLAVLVIVSLLPHRDIDATLRPLFLVAFGSELAGRLVLMARTWRARDREHIVFICIDTLAFSSFLPLERWLEPRHLLVLTLLRLTRLLVLLRFTRELARDVYTIVTRREQLQQFGLVTAAVFAFAFVSAVVLSQLQVPHPYSGGSGPEGFLDRLWWSFRQLESADNLVESLRVHPLVVATSLGLTITGVFAVSYIIGIGTNVVAQVIRTERLREVGYKHHTLVVGAVQDSELLVREFVRIYDKNRRLRRHRPREVWAWLFHDAPPPRRHALPRMALLGSEDEPPAYLYEPNMRWVVYRTGSGGDVDALERAGAHNAKRALLLAPGQAGHDIDAVNITTLAAFRSLNRSAHVFIELFGERSREIAQTVGGPGTFPLDVSSFLGQLVCEHILMPGAELLYRDLLTPEGAETYTHIFVDAEEHRALERMAVTTHVRFRELARVAHESFGVVLTGVFLGDGPWPHRVDGLVGVDGLRQWLNPEAESIDDAFVVACGGRPGEVPLRALRGLIGVAESYLPLRRFAHAFLAGRCRASAPAGEGPDEAAPALEEMCLTATATRRVLVVGFSPALPALLAKLVRFVPHVEVILALGARGDETVALRQRLEALPLGFAEGGRLPGEEGLTASLEGGGRIVVFTHEGSDLVGFAGRCLAGVGPADAAVFLSEPDAADRDSRTALRLLRFAQSLERGEVPRGERLHVVAEFASLRKGERIQQHLDSRRCGFADASRLRLTLVSTDEIKNCFMVHSAFVPGVTALYAELLGDKGQTIVRLEMPASAPSVPVRFAAILEAVFARHAVAIALELRDGRVLLAPDPARTFALSSITAVFVMTKRDREPGG